MNKIRLAIAILFGLAFALFATPASAFQKGTLEFDYCVQLHMERMLWQLLMPSPSRELWEAHTHMDMQETLIKRFMPIYTNQCSMEERYAMADVPRDSIAVSYQAMNGDKLALMILVMWSIVAGVLILSIPLRIDLTGFDPGGSSLSQPAL